MNRASDHPFLAVPPAPSAEALHYFAQRMDFETDCADVRAGLAADPRVFVLLDVRSPEAFARGHVPGAVNLPWRSIDAERLRCYPREMVFVVYCAGPHCNAATRAAMRLAALDRPVKEMLGGITGWLDEGFPLASR